MAVNVISFAQIRTGRANPEAVPTGGLSGQLFGKLSDVPYDTGWMNSTQGKAAILAALGLDSLTVTDTTIVIGVIKSDMSVVTVTIPLTNSTLLSAE